MSGCIISNTAVLALDRYPIEEYKLAVYENINTAFAILFVAELGIKLTGLGIKTFFSD